jgi:nucleotide-binding universal stress UspA family protein
MAIDTSQQLRVLVPLDGSPAAEGALDHALALARAFTTTICLLRVIEPDARFWASTETVDWQLRRRQAEAYLRRAAERLAGARVPVRCRLEEGRAAEIIVDLCRKGEADLLIMTRYGRGGASAFRFGGTVQKVLFAAPGSVMVVDPGGKPGSRYGHILVPIDGSRQSEWAVGIATMLAQAHQGRVTMLQVIERPGTANRLWASTELLQLTERMTELRYLAAQRRAHECAARLPQCLDASFEVAIADDTPAAIQHFAEEHGADLIVMSAHGVSESSPRAYGDVSRTLLEQCSRPVLVCRTPITAGGRSCFQSAFLSESRADAG